MSHTPEHDKIDALREANPLATNLAHLLLNSEGWILENKLTDPPVRIPVTRIAAALLGVDPKAYRREVAAQFGISTVPAQIAAIVSEWSGEAFVIDEVKAIDDEADARTKTLISKVAAESPIGASVAKDHPELLTDGAVFAPADPHVDDALRGSLLGAAVSLGLIGNDAAYDHPKFGAPLTAEAVFGEPIPAPATALASVPADNIATPTTEPAVAAPDAAAAEPAPASATAPEPATDGFHYDLADGGYGYRPADDAEQAPFTAPEPGSDVIAPAPIPQDALDLVGEKTDVLGLPPEEDPDTFDFSNLGAASLDIPAFESGDIDPLQFAGPDPTAFQPPAWDPDTAFGGTDFSNLGLTPPDQSFQFGSYDLTTTSDGDDFNGPILDPLTYDATAAVEGVTEATDDATLQAQADEALAYLTQAAPVADDVTPFPAPELAVEVPTFTDPTLADSDESAPSEPVVVPVFEPAPVATPTNIPTTFQLPESLPAAPVATPEFDAILTTPTEPVEERHTWQNFDLINVPDGTFEPVPAKSAIR